MARIVTDDGWCVEVIMLNDRQLFRVTRHGFIVRPSGTRYDPKAEFTSIDQVQAAMGESFARLRDAG